MLCAKRLSGIWLPPVAPVVARTFPLADAREGDERGEVLIAGGIASDERRRMPVYFDLRSDDRLDGPLADGAITPAELRVVGKGRKERIGLLGRAAIAALRAYLDEGRPELLAASRAGGSEATAALFINHRGGPLGPRGVRFRIERARRHAGFARCSGSARCRTASR